MLIGTTTINQGVSRRPVRRVKQENLKGHPHRYIYIYIERETHIYGISISPSIYIHTSIDCIDIWMFVTCPLRIPPTKKEEIIVLPGKRPLKSTKPYVFSLHTAIPERNHCENYICLQKIFPPFVDSTLMNHMTSSDITRVWSLTHGPRLRQSLSSLSLTAGRWPKPTNNSTPSQKQMFFWGNLPCIKYMSLTWDVFFEVFYCISCICTKYIEILRLPLRNSVETHDI